MFDDFFRLGTKINMKNEMFLLVFKREKKYSDIIIICKRWGIREHNPTEI